MTLTLGQLQKIETYLDIKELTHLDLRNEVMDHMAIDIENSIEENNLGFQEAFKQVIDKWNPELADYSSWWLGWVWTGPKITMRKCVEKTKQICLRTLIGTLGIMILLYLLTYVGFDIMEYREELNGILGVGYSAFLLLILFFHLKIKASDYHTSYRFLFKINAIGFAFMYLTFNPFLSDSFNIGVLFFHSFLLSFICTYWDLYKAHFKAKKLILA